MSVSLSSLDPQQLMGFKQNTNQELAHLQSSYDALLMAQTKYRDCINSVKMIEQTKKAETDDDMFIPLTSSLYVRGRNSVDKFKIDVGTGYFVEKDQAEAISFFNKRIDKLSSDAVKLKQLIAEKVNLLQALDNTIKEKIIAANASANRQGAATGASSSV